MFSQRPTCVLRALFTALYTAARGETRVGTRNTTSRARSAPPRAAHARRRVTTRDSKIVAKLGVLTMGAYSEYDCSGSKRRKVTPRLVTRKESDHGLGR